MLSSSFRVPNNQLIKWVAKVRSYQLFGREIPDLKIEWKPLRVMTAEQEQAIKNNKINGYMQLVQNGILTRRQCAEKLVSDKAENNKENEMALLDELKKLVNRIENKGEDDMDEVENGKVDKRKLIDEIGGILKGKVDDELIRTIIGKAEEIAYEESEAGTADNKKAKNETKRR